MKWTPDKLRAFERKLSREFEKGLINCPLHLCGGNEEQLIEIFKDIKDTDYVFSTHRNHYHYLLHSGSVCLLRKSILGKNTQRSMNFQDPKRRFYTSAIVGGNCAIAVGVALGLHRSSSTDHVWCFVGDGATDQGHFWEAARFALGRKLPITFIVEDNDRSVDSSRDNRWSKWSTMLPPNVTYYRYERVFPHVGVGKHVTF